MRCLYVLLFIFLLLGAYYSAMAQVKSEFESREVYRTENLILTQISAGTFIHTSFLQTNDFGKVPCNGLVVTDGKEALVFDTPTDVAVSEELIQWITKNQKLEIKGIVPTHFHNDCLGGLQAFEELEIPSYATFKTIDLARENNYVVPKNGFADSLVLKVGDRTVLVKHYGEGHTKDNVVAYFPSERVLFGGCLVKEVDATRGYLGDANLDTWSGTVEAVKKGFPETKIVVPGHGKHGGVELLDYTIKLFQTRHFGERNGNEVK
jgi:metallo-beta-lactamase class B